MRELRTRIMDSAPAPSRPREAKALTPLIEAFEMGLGDETAPVLSGSMDRVAASFIDLITTYWLRLSNRPALVLAVAPQQRADRRPPLGRQRVALISAVLAGPCVRLSAQ